MQVIIMANWSDVLYLIALVKGNDDEGFETLVPGEPRKVYANRKSVRSQEFHMAKQQGITLSYMLDVRTNEYLGEEKVSYNDEDHVVYRTYEKGEFTELILHKDGEKHD